jgi:aspartyl-tRNA(Asn)/glutamyl-tRNA(Gln) amidotransferase subunit A
VATHPLLLASASEQARAVLSGHISAEDLLQLQLQAIDHWQPALNSYIARTPATTPEKGFSLLAGSSFAAKDNFDVAGLPSASGLRALSRMPTRDATVVARLRAAGLSCLGKLNMHPMALGASNHNPDFGNCFNPVGASLTPGGSSGGSGAAVAAGLCGIALGSDTMGSVRIPAAYCGVVGFKPSHETLGLDGIDTLCRWLDHVGLLARSVEDITAAMLITAPQLPPAHSPVARRWRVGVVQDLPALGASEAVCLAFGTAIGQLQQSLPMDVVPLHLAASQLGASRRAGLLLCEAELHHRLVPLLRDRPDSLPTDLLNMMHYIERKSALDLGQALAQVARTGEQLDTLLRGLDAVLMPTAPQVAFAMDMPPPPNQADFTAMANMNGAPAISLPLPVAPGALPVGLQAVGQRGHDLALLQLAVLLEHALKPTPTRSP